MKEIIIISIAYWIGWAWGRYTLKLSQNPYSFDCEECKEQNKSFKFSSNMGWVVEQVKADHLAKFHIIAR